MPSCTECIKPKPIARCLTNLIIGTIADLNTDIDVFITNLTTERKTVFEVTSDGAGLVTVPIEGFKFSENHSYEITIVKDGSDNIGEHLDITIGSSVSKCIQLRFDNSINVDGDSELYTNQKLS